MNRLSLAAKHRVRGLLSPLILRARSRDFTPADAYIVSGFFRSGTTWLAELVSKSINAGIVFEPFHIERVREAKDAGLSYSNFHSPRDPWPKGIAFVDKVLRGKVLTSWTAAHIPVANALNMDKLVVKLVGSNQVLPWLTEHFEVPAPALIVRHPCAVLASWLNRGWRLNSWIARDRSLLARYPEIAIKLDSLSLPEEFFAARWCIDHFVPMTGAEAKRFTVVPFEKLVIDGPDFLEDLLGKWGLRLPEDVREEFRQPSEKASNELRFDYESVLAGWKKSLSKRQISAVLQVVRSFGLDFYANDVEPDYDRLFSAEPVIRG